MDPNLTCPIVLNASINTTLNPASSNVTGSIVRNFDNYEIIIQTQDPWITVFSVFIGGIIALIANYFLQMRSFKFQNEITLMDKRISAYNSLLGHISNYESDNSVAGRQFIADMGFYLSRAFTYGSPEIRVLIKPEIIKEIKKTTEFDTSIVKIKKAIIEEILEEKSKNEELGRFWRK